MECNERKKAIFGKNRKKMCIFSKINKFPVNKIDYTVKPFITNTSKEFLKCRLLHFLIMECCRYLVF